MDAPSAKTFGLSTPHFIILRYNRVPLSSVTTNVVLAVSPVVNWGTRKLMIFVPFAGIVSVLFSFTDCELEGINV